MGNLLYYEDSMEIPQNSVKAETVDSYYFDPPYFLTWTGSSASWAARSQHEVMAQRRYAKQPKGVNIKMEGEKV